MKAVQVSEQVASRLRLSSGERFTLEIEQPSSTCYVLKNCAYMRVRKDGRFVLRRVVLSEKRVNSESELWAAVSDFSQNMLCDAADREELAG